MPWAIRRLVLNLFLQYEIAPTARIGFSWILPGKLIMGPHSRIGNGTMCKGIDLLHLEEYATIGNGNWITGFPSNNKEFFDRSPNRLPQLIVKRHAAITARHILDATDQIIIGEFSILAGFNSQIITHSIDIKESCQSCAPISIGKFCFAGSRSIFLGNSKLPDYSILAAGSVCGKNLETPYRLYGGVPAVELKDLPPDYGYFKREVGMIN